MKYKKLNILKMMDMKNKIFYLKLIILVLVVINGVTFHILKENSDAELCLYENDSSYVLVEKNVINKNFISYLYKNNKDNYISKIYDYNTSEELDITGIIKEETINKYNDKIEKLLYLKYPKFIAKELIKDNTKKSYLFRDNELVIYFNDYDIHPEVFETLFLKVNYNEIKEYINFTVLLDSKYENESGYNYNNSKKSIAITFDDSPNIGKTNKILKYLNDNHFHATFFVVGEKCEYNEDLLLSIKNNGNEIGSHTYSHQNLSKIDDEDLIEDYNKVNNIYKRLFDEDIKYLRPPYGIYKDNQLSILDVSFILWSLDTNDWKYKNSDYLVNYVLDNVKDGDIILFHDSYSSTVDAIEKLLPLLYSKGYQVMSVSELSHLKGINIENNKVYHNFS